MIKFAAIPKSFVRIYMHNRIKLACKTPEDIQQVLVALPMLLKSKYPYQELEPFVRNVARIENVDPSSMLRAVEHIAAIFSVLSAEVSAEEIAFLRQDIEAVYDEQITSRYRVNYS